MYSTPTRLSEWLQLIRAEFEEPGGLRVTAAEARERWPLEPIRVVSILDALVQARYLSRSPDGVYFRRAERADGAGVSGGQRGRAVPPGPMSLN
jgi:hypothetical protein